MQSYIKFPVLRFKKTDLTHENLENLFYIKEQQGIEWQNTFLDALQNGMYEYADFLAAGYDITLHKYLVDKLLDSFSLELKNVDNMMMAAAENSEDVIKSITCDDNNIEIKLIDGIVKAEKFFHAYPNLIGDFPEIITKNRYGKCHMLSLRFAMLSDVDGQVATGYVAPLARKNKILHSWVETKLNGKDVVIDFVRGLVFDKESYYYLKNIDNRVEKIDLKTVASESIIIDKLYKTEPFFTKIYFSNHRQALKIYNQIINPSDNEKIQSEPNI